MKRLRKEKSRILEVIGLCVLCAIYSSAPAEQSQPSPPPKEERPSTPRPGEAAPPAEETAPPPEEPLLQLRSLDTVVAMVNGEAITLGDLQRYSNPLLDLYRKRGVRPTAREKEEFLKRQLESLIDRKLILMEGKERGARIEEWRVRETILALREVKDAFEGNLGKFLAAKGITYRQLYNEFEEEMLLSALIREKAVPKVRVSPAEIQEYYQRNIGKYTEEAAIHCFAITFMKRDNPEAAAAVLAKAREALEKIRQGANFPDVAKTYSEDPVHADKGGDWAWITPETLEKKASDAAFALKEGQHSGIVEGDAADWILWVKEKREESVLPLSAVWKEIELELRAEKLEAEIRRWGQRLRLKAAITYPVPLSALLSS